MSLYSSNFSLSISLSSSSYPFPILAHLPSSFPSLLPSPLLPLTPPFPLPSFPFPLLPLSSPSLLPFFPSPLLLPLSSSSPLLFFPSPLLLPQAPEPIQTGLQFNSDQTNRQISLSWSGAFNLNSRLIHYIVSRNGISVQQLQGTQVTLTQEPVGIRKLKARMTDPLHAAYVIGLCLQLWSM